MLVWVDAGHGGKDPGASGPSGTRESDICLLAAKELKVLLERKGHKVAMTRDKDEYVDLSQRARNANFVRAGLFVSLHCNASADPNAHGLETYIHTTAGEYARALAGGIQARVPAATGLTDRGVKKAGFAVLRLTWMPAILVEMAFISNPREEAMLQDAEWRTRLLENLAALI
jgi:N-acetylmuramoyl-L-alanine amidase